MSSPSLSFLRIILCLVCLSRIFPSILFQMLHFTQNIHASLLWLILLHSLWLNVVAKPTIIPAALSRESTTSGTTISTTFHQDSHNKQEYPRRGVDEHWQRKEDGGWRFKVGVVQGGDDDDFEHVLGEDICELKC